MKILHTVPYIGEEASGPAYSVPRLCESLEKSGMETVLCSIGDTAIDRGFTHLTFKRAAFPHPRLGRSHELKQWMYKNRDAFSVIHSHSLWMASDIYAWRAARLSKNTKLVIAPRGTLTPWALAQGRIQKWIAWNLLGQRRALFAADLIHATSQAEHEDIRRIGIKASVAIIPNGIDIPEETSTAPPNPLMTNVLFLSRIHPTKGIELLLKAWKEVMKASANKKLQLNIVGPEYRPGYILELKQQASDLGLSNVSFPGPFYGKEKQAAYQKADLFVLPTHSENFGLVVGEALASGTPAIVTKGAPWSGLTKNKCGWWIDRNVPSLAAALLEAVNLEKERLTEMGQRGRQWVAKEFSWEELAENMIQCYQWLHGKSEKPDCVVCE